MASWNTIRWCSATSVAHACSSRSAHRRTRHGFAIRNLWPTQGGRLFHREFLGHAWVLRELYQLDGPLSLSYVVPYRPRSRPEPPPCTVRHENGAKVPLAATIGRMRRTVLLAVGLIVAAVGILLLGYALLREREYQRLLAQGDAALAADQTFGHRGVQRGDRPQERLDDCVSEARRDLPPAGRAQRGAPGPAVGRPPRPGRRPAGRTARRRQLRPGPLCQGRRELPDLRVARRPVASRLLQARPRALPRRQPAGRHRGLAQGGGS